MRSLAECDNLWLVMHDLSLLKTSKHLLQHGSPSAALVVWPPFFQTHPPQSASSSGFLACQNPENRMIDSSRQQARWKGSTALCVGKTQETEDRVQSQKAALQGTFNTRGVKTGNYTIKSLNPRGPDLHSIVCYCCFQIRDFRSRAWLLCGFIIIFFPSTDCYII